MAYVPWPAAFPTPTTPLPFDRMMPLSSSGSEDIGRFETQRNRTRPTFVSSIVVPMDAALFNDFRLFWRDDLSHGTKLMTADWLTDTGYPEYVARITTYTVTLEGVEPRIALSLELIPDVNLDPTNTFPDAWPPI